MKVMPEGGIVIRRKHLFIVVAVLTLVAVSVATTLFVVHRSSQAEQGVDKTKQETQQVIRLVGRHFELPTTEQPTVAKIQDLSKLKNQQFFARAQNGDYLLLYNNERLALIYRKSIDKLINVGPINADPTQDMDDVPTQSLN